MTRKFIIAILASVVAVPAFAHNTQMPTVQIPPSQVPPQPVLRLMNDTEFSTFLEQLDSSLVRSQRSLEAMDLGSLGLDLRGKQEAQKSFNRCLQSIESSRDEIQKLSVKQTLKLDLFLLIELNDLTRNLDALDENLMNPAGMGATGGMRKSLAYAREVLNIDGALADRISVFQHHFIAFAGLVDDSLAQADTSESEGPAQK